MYNVARFFQSRRISNRAPVAGNCSSLLPGAARVQSRIHEFLVRSPPLRSFFTYVSTSASTPSPFLSRAAAPDPPSFVYRVCTENISHACRTCDRKKWLDVNWDAHVIIENAKCAAFISTASSSGAAVEIWSGPGATFQKGFVPFLASHKVTHSKRSKLQPALV